MAKKRKAEDQISGVPVNKRKSLLMKPRHYSPNLECKEENEDRTELQEDISILESSSAPGSWWTPLEFHSKGDKPQYFETGCKMFDF